MSDSLNITGADPAAIIKDKADAKPAAAPDTAPKAAPALSGTPSPLAAATASTDLATSFKKNSQDYHTLMGEKPQYKPADPMSVFGSMAGIISVFGALLTRQPLLAGLEAGAAAMNARKQNDDKTYSIKMQEWHDNVNEVLQQNKMANEYAKSVLEDKKLDFNTKIALLRVQQGNEKIAIAARNGDLRSAEAIIRHNDAINSHLDASLDRNYNAGMHLFTATLANVSDPDQRKEAYNKLAELDGKTSLGSVSKILKDLTTTQKVAGGAKGIPGASDAIKQLQSGHDTIIGGMPVSVADYKATMSTMGSMLNAKQQIIKQAFMDSVKAPGAGAAASAATPPTGSVDVEKEKAALGKAYQEGKITKEQLAAKLQENGWAQ